MFHFPSADGSEPEVIDLADGRILLLPAGRSGRRAYQVRSYEHGHAVRRRLEWLGRATGAAVAALVLAAWLWESWTLCLLIPAVLVLHLVGRQAMLAGLNEVTDPAARREAAAAEEASSAVGLALVALSFALAMGRFLMRDNPSPRHAIEPAFTGLALIGAGIQFWRRYRADQEQRTFQVSEIPDNKPIVPR